MKKRLQTKVKQWVAIVSVFSVLSGQMLLSDGVFLQEAQAAGFNMNGSKWSEPYLRSLYDNGIMTGDAYGNMNPDRNITRAEFVTMLNRGLGYHETTGKTNFKDITGTEWYANEIDIAATQGYFVGNNKNSAGASDNLTREQAVAFLTRNLKYEEDDRVNTDYVDGIDFPTWSRGSINAASDKGVVSGYQDGTFRPKRNITRAEAGTLLYNALGKIIKEPGTYSYGNWDGNVTISKSGVTLTDTVINGDLYITEGVELGFTNLNNVIVTGQVIISGGGESNVGQSSITFTNSTVKEMIIDAPEDQAISVKADGSTKITTTKVKSLAYLEELSDAGGFDNVELNGPEDTDLHLLGSFDTVTVKGEKNNLYLDSGDINTLVIDETAVDSTTTLNEDTYVAEAFVDVKTTINGTGDIGQVTINANDVVISMLPDNIILRPGATATINGKQMTSKDAAEASSYPRILSQYPKIDEVDATKVTALVKTNKPGTIYWAVTELDNGSVSDDDLLKPSKRQDIIKSGTMSVAASDTEYSISISGLQKDTDYILSAVLVDDREDVSTREKKNFVTTDNTKPQYLSGYPKVTETTNTTVTVSAMTNKDLTTYWALFPTGTLAPTASEVRRGKLSGHLASGKITDCKKNIEFNFGISGLDEKEVYDLYIVGNDGITDTNLVKLTFTTMDQTAPRFMEDYPKQNKVTKSSVEVLYKVNEDAKVYYVVMERGADFPPPPLGSAVIPALTSDEAKEAVVNGAAGLKKGSGTAKMEQEGKVNISGLEEQVAYDLYMVAVDNDGNMSEIAKILIKTLDEIPPTATQEFTETLKDYPTVATDIRIVFSEEVKVIQDNEFVELSPENLAEHITLWDTTTREKKEVTINYEKAEVTLEKGKTVVTFPSRSIPLNSGSKYQFELNKIVDTNNNKMEDNTLLPEFQTTPSLVMLEQTIAPQQYDVTFTATPQSNDTNDELLYDMLFYSSSNITFDLYEKGPNDADFKLLTGVRLNLDGTPEDYDAQINATDGVNGVNGISLHYILDRIMNNEPSYIFERFNQLQPKEYAIKIKSINGQPESAGWTASVEMSIRCIVGSRTALQPAAGSPSDGFDDAITAGALEVTDPSPFTMTIPFVDTVVPKFLDNYPMLDRTTNTVGIDEYLSDLQYVEDFAIYPRVSADKEAMMHYLIIPAVNAGTANITSEDVFYHNIKPTQVQGAVDGTFSIASAGLEYDDLKIENLKPDTEYIMYSVLKGTPPEPSRLYINRFKTKPLIAPNITNIEVKKNPDDEKSVIIEVTVDKNCDLDWIVYQAETSNGYDGGEVTAEMIRNRQSDAEVSKQPHDSGSVTGIQVDPEVGTATIQIIVSGLIERTEYRFHAVAKNIVGNSGVEGFDSAVAWSERFSASDNTAPYITFEPKKAGGYRPEYDHGEGWYGAATGAITMDSGGEPLYYIDGTSRLPLTPEFFKEELEVNPNRNDYDINPSFRARYMVTETSMGVPVDKMTGARVGEAGITSAVIKYTNVPLGATISFPYVLCDAYGNIVGKFTLTLEEQADYNPDGSFRRWWAFWKEEWTEGPGPQNPWVQP